MRATRSGPDGPCGCFPPQIHSCGRGVVAAEDLEPVPGIVEVEQRVKAVLEMLQAVPVEDYDRDAGDILGQSSRILRRMGHGMSDNVGAMTSQLDYYTFMGFSSDDLRRRYSAYANRFS